MTGSNRRKEHGSIDWDAIRQRIASLDAVLSGDAAASAEAADDLLRERARALARKITHSHEKEAAQWVVFELSAEAYAVEARFVVEVLRHALVTPLPGAAAPLVGLTGWRGELLPVLDLHHILGIAQDPSANQDHLVVFGGGKAAFGVRVEEVQGLRDLHLNEAVPLADGIVRDAGLVRGTTSDAVMLIAGQDLIRTYP